MKTTSKKAASTKSSNLAAGLTPREQSALLRKAAAAKAEQAAWEEARIAKAKADREFDRRYNAAMAAFKKKPEPKLGKLGTIETFNVVLVTGTSTARPSAQHTWTFTNLPAAKAAMEKLLARAAYEEVVNRKAPSAFMAEPNGFRIVRVGTDGRTEVVVPTVGPVGWVLDAFGA